MRNSSSRPQVSRVFHDQDRYLFVDIVKSKSRTEPFLNPLSGSTFPTQSLAEKDARLSLENKYQTLLEKYS